MSGVLRQSKKFAEMKTIGIILGGIFILCMIAYIIRIVVEGSRKGHDFTMKNPPKPPQKARTYESMTYSELSNLYLLYKQKIEAVAAEMKRRHNEHTGTN